jgi:16S rRNA (guanine966-N2)-methyltransferase
MRIVGGEWRGRKLVAPPGQGTRPTADRVRQALFDMIMHAEWGGRGLLDGATVLDVFAGTGALGLESLSRGAARATFIESDPVALRALRSNIAACKAGSRAEVLAIDALAILPGSPANVVFLDPPYSQALIPRALTRLLSVGRIQSSTLMIVETGRDETWCPDQPLLAERQHAAARLLVFRL